MNEKVRLVNPYRRGADDGFMFGLYMIALFFASVFASTVTACSILMVSMMLAVPAILYMRLRRTWIEDRGMSLFSSLWMQGIMMFMCGALISGVVSYIYLRWINPGWFEAEMEQAIVLYRSLDGGAQVAEILQRMIDRHLLPTTMQLVVQMMLLEIFTGSMLTMLVTLLVRTYNKGCRQMD